MTYLYNNDDDNNNNNNNNSNNNNNTTNNNNNNKYIYIYTYIYMYNDNYSILLVLTFLWYLTSIASGTNSSAVLEVKKPAGDKMCRRWVSPVCNRLHSGHHSLETDQT